MTSNMREALKGSGGGLQEISSSVGEALSGSVDGRGSKQRKADEASADLKGMGQSKGATVEGTKIKAADQIANQNSGSADHLDLGFRKS